MEKELLIYLISFSVFGLSLFCYSLINLIKLETKKD